jgi:hypothetical protein
MLTYVYKRIALFYLYPSRKKKIFVWYFRSYRRQVLQEINLYCTVSLFGYIDSMNKGITFDISVEEVSTL